MPEKPKYKKEVLKALLTAEKPLRANNIYNIIAAKKPSAKYHSTLKQLKSMLEKEFLALDKDTETYVLKPTLPAFLKVAKICLKVDDLKAPFSKSKYLENCLNEQLWNYIILQLFDGANKIWSKFPEKEKTELKKQGIKDGVDSVALVLNSPKFSEFVNGLEKLSIGFDSRKQKDFVNQQDPRQILMLTIALSPTALYHSLFTPLMDNIKGKNPIDISIVPLISDKRLELYKFDNKEQQLVFNYLYTFFMSCLLNDLITFPELVDSKERAGLALKVFDFGEINFDYTLFESPEYKKDLQDLAEYVLSIANSNLGQRNYKLVSEKFKEFQKTHYGEDNRTTAFSDITQCPHCSVVNSFKVRPDIMVSDIWIKCFECKKFFNTRYIISRKTTKEKPQKVDDSELTKIKKQNEKWVAEVLEEFIKDEKQFAAEFRPIIEKLKKGTG